MSWNNAAEFWAMGGYGLYVWGSYAVAAACMLIEPLQAHGRFKLAARRTRYAAESEL